MPHTQDNINTHPTTQKQRGASFPKVAADPRHPRRLVAAADVAAGGALSFGRGAQRRPKPLSSSDLSMLAAPVICMFDDVSIPHTTHATQHTTTETLFRLPCGLLLHGALAFDDPEYGGAFRALAAEEAAAAASATTAAAAGVPTAQGGGGAAAAAPAVPLDGRALLALLLVVERCRGAAARWAPYVSFLPEAFGALTAALRCAALRRVSFGGFWRRLWDGAKNEGGLRRLSALHSIWVSFCCR